MSLLEIKGSRSSFPVRSVAAWYPDFSVGAGEVVGLVGDNGAGGQVDPL